MGKFCKFVIGVVVSFLAFSGTLAQEPGRILYLHLKRDSAGISLLGASLHPGRLKNDAARGELEYEIEGLISGRLPDPVSVRIEYEDPDLPGRLLSKQIQRPSGEFTLRLPGHAAGRSVRFFQRRALAGADLSAQGVQVQREFLGEVAIPAEPARLQSLASSARRYTLVNNGPVSSRLNIAVLAEGFTASEESNFTNQAMAVVEQFLSVAPYDKYRFHFNAFAIFVASAESGSDHPSRGEFRNTYFNSSYDSYGLNRLITIPPNERNSSYSAGQGRVVSLLGQFVPDYDIALLLVNDSEYGGSGGVPAITSINESAPEIAVHEIGHSFAGLGDEYDSPYPGYPDTEEPNTTVQTRRDLIKWRNWILASTPVPTPENATYAARVGLFEGAHFHTTGWYRPKLDCKMRTLGVDFCEVCQETLVIGAYTRLGIIQGSSPPENNVSVPGGGERVLRIDTIDPIDSTLKYTWTIDGLTNEVFTSNSFSASFSTLGSGSKLVRVVAHDPTPLVRTDPLGKLWQSRSWLVQVQGPTNVPPTISAIADQQTFVGNTVGPIAFTISDPDTPLSSISVSTRSSVTNLVRNEDITVTGTGTNRTLTFVVSAESIGVTTITLDVSDGASTVSESFNVTISPQTAELLLSIPDQRAFSGTITVAIGVTGRGYGPLTFTASSSNPQLLPESSIEFRSANNTYSAILNPTLGVGGSSDVVVTATDGVLQAVDVFNVTVLSLPLVNGTLARDLAGGLRLRFTADSPVTMILEESSDMNFWTPLSTQPNATVLEFLVPNAALNAKSFYRTRLVPL